MASDSMHLFQEEAPAVAQAFDELIGTLRTESCLDAKTMQLIYIGIKASQGDVGSVAAHAPMAKALGASRDELRDAVLLTLTVSGFRGVTCLAAAVAPFDDQEERAS